jgi:ribosome biogenesis GTPase / thiamine phosphate phosphatase
MREVGIVNSTSRLEITFEKIIRLAQNCKFKDCTHTNEVGCAVIEADAKGEIDRAFL